jgi:opacity protein-like surface antigen
MARIHTTVLVVVLATGISSAAFAAPSAVSEAGTEPQVSSERADYEKSPPTLFGKKTAIGGYGSLDVAYTRMFDKDGAVVGLQGALLFNHRLALGLGLYGWTNPQQGPDNELGEERSFQTAYGGATVRYSLFPQSPVYLSVGGLVGGGGVVLARDDEDGDEVIRDEDADAFAVFQPDVTVHANLTRWMRIGVMAGYRFTAGVESFDFDESDVNGVVVGGQVQLGRF